jgi:outer membrane protein insertion porin family
MMFLAATTLQRFVYLFIIAVFFILFHSCTVVRNPPPQPFVYDYNIELQGKFSTDERKNLVSQLEKQLHDSIRVRQVQTWIFWKRLKNPPVYDSINVGSSKIYMSALLNSLGYARDSIRHNIEIETVAEQKRVTVNFAVDPGKLIHLDSVWYSFNRKDTGTQLGNDTLQYLAEITKEQSLLKKGAAFSKPLIASERDRLTNIFRNNGFLLFSSEEIIAVWDTVGLGLLTPTSDPIELARQLELLRQRRENPVADVEVRLRANNDTSHLRRFYNGNITIYPDIASDTALYVLQYKTINGYNIITYFDRYKPEVLAENIFIRKGGLYNQREYLRTLNRFNSIGSWRLVNITQRPRINEDTVDYVVQLTPAVKYNYTANIEGSQNIGRSFTTQGNLLGVGFNLGLRNSNFARGANIANTNLRFGTELSAGQNQNLVQTVQVTGSHTISFPRLYPKWVNRFVRNEEKRTNAKTNINLNAGYLDRIEFFNVKFANISFGYETSWKNKLLSVRLPNIEYNYLKPYARLRELIDSNASYNYIFNTGLVMSSLGNLTIAGGRRNHSKVTRIGAELAGFFAGFIPRSKFLDSNLYRFAKLDFEHKQTITIRRTQLAWRTFLGIGLGLPRGHIGTGNERDSLNLYLPFFRQYYAGGPNSMRAWGVRQLGPGSRIASFARNVAPDRFGDLQFEANLEYRFYIANVNGIIVNSALYTDIGNVWYLRDDPKIENEKFRFDRLGQDIAIGAGTGLRLDFGFLKLRLDYAYKVKNPSRQTLTEKQWFYNWGLFNGQLQFGIDYPF